uniref:Uncharacterized protein n=1 Tax=Anguilla anguilla TaxID=7936 RepID=A0A0E9TF87_ANGAN
MPAHRSHVPEEGVLVTDEDSRGLFMQMAQNVVFLKDCEISYSKASRRNFQKETFLKNNKIHSELAHN